MSMGNQTFHERTLRSTLNPASVNGASASSPWVNVSNARRLCALIAIGATDAAVDAKIEQASDSSGTGAKDISGAAITQLTSTSDNKQASIDLETDRLDHAAGFGYVRLTVTVASGTTGAVVAGEVLMTARHQPVTQPATYVEKVVVAG